MHPVLKTVAKIFFSFLIYFQSYFTIYVYFYVPFQIWFPTQHNLNLLLLAISSVFKRHLLWYRVILWILSGSQSTVRSSFQRLCHFFSSSSWAWLEMTIISYGSQETSAWQTTFLIACNVLKTVGGRHLKSGISWQTVYVLMCKISQKSALPFLCARGVQKSISSFCR